jgi:hypothetical protein
VSTSDFSRLIQIVYRAVFIGRLANTLFKQPAEMLRIFKTQLKGYSVTVLCRSKIFSLATVISLN